MVNFKTPVGKFKMGMGNFKTPVGKFPTGDGKFKMSIGKLVLACFLSRIECGSSCFT